MKIIICILLLFIIRSTVFADVITTFTSKAQISDNIGKAITTLFPKGAFLRDYEKLTDVNDNIYIGLYVTEFGNPLFLVPLQDVINTQISFAICPENKQEQLIKGKYFLFANKNNKIISETEILTNIDDSSGISSLSFCNTSFNNCYYFTFMDKKCKSTNTIEKNKTNPVIGFDKYGRENEFLLTGIHQACGFVDYFSYGFDEENKKIIVYSISDHNELCYLFERFAPINGECSVIIMCDDDGNDTYQRSDYKFSSI